MAPPRKTLKQYEKEAVKQGSCLVHASQGAARKVYQMRHNKILPSHIAVCHKCDNPKCIKDSHHFEGTWKDNVQDAVRKGRHSCFRKGGVRFSGTHTEEAKKKIGEASKARWAAKSDEQKKAIAQKISAVQKGVARTKHTEETKAKMRASHARRLGHV